MDTDCVEGDEGGVDEGRDDRVKDGADEHDAFDEEDEEGEDGDYDVEICDAKDNVSCEVSDGRVILNAYN